jgi:hypothetical protein
LIPHQAVHRCDEREGGVEADDHNASEGWSIIVKGTAQVLNTDAESEEAWRAQRLPWTAGMKPRYVRVYPSEVSGRRFRFGSESDTN